MKIVSMLAGCCCLALCFISVAAFAPADTLTALPMLDDGKEAFERNCAECHGVKVAEIAPTTKKAKDKGPDLTGIGEKYQAMDQEVRHGRSGTRGKGA